MIIYILHGWAYSTEKWKPFIEALVSKGHTVHLLNIPGLTASVEKPWGVGEYVTWLKEVTDKENKPFMLIGHSNGGRIAIAFTAEYPDRVGELVLVDSAGIIHKDTLSALKRKAFGHIAHIGKQFTTSKIVRKVFYKVVGESDYNNAPPMAKEIMKKMLAFDAETVLPRIKGKTTIIWGEHDSQTPLSDGKRIQSLLPQSTFYMVKGARHSPQFTNVDEVLLYI